MNAMDNWFRSTIMPNIKYKEFLRKHTTEDIVNKMQEDAPANAVAHGGVDMNPDGKKVKKKKENDAEDMLRRVIMNKLSDKIKEENDNNSTTLRGVLDTLNKVEKISDKYLGVNEEVKIVEDKEYKSFKEKYNG
jgi:hypothetical protein